MNSTALESKVARLVAAPLLSWACLGLLGRPNALAAADDGAAVYAPILRDPAHDIVLGRVVAVVPPPPNQAGFGQRRQYRIEVLGDMRQRLTEHMTITILGESGMMTASAGTGVDLHVAVGLPAVFLVHIEDAPGPAQYMLDKLTLFVFPFGIEALDPSVRSSDVPDLLAALSELKAALAKPDGEQPTHDHAIELIRDRNPYLWALGCWRLAHMASREDMNLLANLPRTASPPLSAGQAVFLDDLFDRVTGAAVDEGAVPGADERRRLLRETLRRQATPSAPAQTRPSAAPAKS